MKKVILLIILAFLLNLTYEERISTTFKEDNEFDFYVLEFPNKNLSTNNFLNYFNDIQVVWVEVDSKYNVKKRYNYTNISELKKSYLKELENNNYKLEAINFKISGFIINKIKIYSNINKINKLNIENIIVNY